MKLKDIRPLLDARAFLLVIEDTAGECRCEALNLDMTAGNSSRLARHDEAEVVNLRPTCTQWRGTEVMTLEVTLRVP